jgi:hypothetical protein
LGIILESGGLRDRAKQRAGLSTEPDLWARETVVSRLEALVQEGYGSESLARLRGAAPPDPGLRLRHGPPISPEEAVALREDMVRYLTYGLWRSPEELVARALAVLTEEPAATFMLSNPRATAGLQAVLDTIDDDARFAERFGPTVGRALARQGQPHDQPAERQELQRLQVLLGPAARLLRDAQAVGLRVIAYQDTADGEGLTAFLAQDLDRGEPAPSAHRQNGSGSQRADQDTLDGEQN